MLHVILAENLARPGRLAEMLDPGDGLNVLAELVRGFTPERVAPAVGIDGATVARMARELAAARAAVCYGRLGTCAQAFGALTSWLIDCLNVVTGNLDRVGGSMFARPAVDLAGIARLIGQTGHFDRWRSRVSDLPEFNGELPASALLEEITTPGPGQIRALVTHAGNPVLSTPGGDRLARALAGLEFNVAIDIYVNETTRHADVILPPTFGLECDHFGLVFRALAVRNTVKYAPAIMARPDGALHDWEIFLQLTRRMLARRNLAGKLAGAGLARVLGRGPGPIIALGLRLGPYRMALRELASEPHGVDLGPLAPRLPGVLPRRAITLVPEPMRRDLARLEAELAAAPGDRALADLTLIGRRQLASNNSWMHNSERLNRGKNRCVLLMHPDDARARGIGDGDRVAIESRTGTLEAAVQLTADMMPGVVSLPHGWGHDQDGVKLSVAASRPGVSVNDITDDRSIDRLSGCTDFAVSVQVTPA